MKTLSLDDVRNLLRDCAGETEAMKGNEDLAGRRFDELGYDSLAVLELCVRVEERFGIRISDEDTVSILTPADLVEYVNSRSMVS